jgi:hypothetical protein
MAEKKGNEELSLHGDEKRGGITGSIRRSNRQNEMTGGEYWRLLD